ncbi:hypothetical protein SAMN02745866_01840 [Alteromonadaceae bacterium Bs31]|nr:hypothetical protein SAMN02745866_01840 [Alteromonadaceae bacterium Bs31]
MASAESASKIVPLHESVFFSPKPPMALGMVLEQARITENIERREVALLAARERWPHEPDSHIALYKFYFISGRYAKAEAAVWAVLRCAANLLGINRNYRLLSLKTAPSRAQGGKVSVIQAGAISWRKKYGPARLYLFSLKALGVCRLRRGRVLAAHCAFKKAKRA